MILATRARRAGFTLVEMLVVITVIAILLALTGVAYQKAAESQRNRSTDDLANRLQPALEAEYDAVVQQAANDIRKNTVLQPQYANTLAFCDNDPDRARAVWTAAKLRQHFPETFAEATSPVTVCPGVIIPALSTFTGPDIAPLSTGGPVPDSAALLYVILAKKSAGGSGGFAADDVTNGMQMDVVYGSVSARVFRDGWGKPVAFKRWWGLLLENNNEVQSAPYVDAKKDFNLVGNTLNRDPLDTANKVFTWTNSANKTALAAAPYYFIGQNRLITVWSPGQNGLFETSPISPTSPNDDLMGYRIRRLGIKGNSP
jgi:prepilin-type N-terminal cleavage/methylation domain-containing protein